MELRLYNTLTRSKDVFAPIEAGNVRLYVCGPTVYDRAHIGNARPLIVFDVLFRLLRHLYGPAHVRYVRNITDVDDKINARAAERGIPIGELTQATIAGFHADAEGLGCLPPSLEPRATQHIAPMIAVIERLIAGGHAYVADGHVLFDTPSMPDYGRLSRRPLDEMIAGARVEVAVYKRSETDFVLWKPAAAHEPGWDSPWGRGRPGWHIECSAMSWTHLGEAFDIHGGGIDLVFPHHENELAQTRCAFGHDVMANVWMHNGFVQVEGEKMAKSAGNFVTINDLLRSTQFGGRAWPSDVIRLAMIKTNYRQPIDWSVRTLEQAQLELGAMYEAVVDAEDDSDVDLGPLIDLEVREALLDDMNTSATVTRLLSMHKDARSNTLLKKSLKDTLRFLGFKQVRKPGYFDQAFGARLFESGPQLKGDIDTQTKILTYRTYVANAHLSAASDLKAEIQSKGFTIDLDPLGRLSVVNATGADTADININFSIEVERLIDIRREARKAKNWAESDRLRDELAAMGVSLKDGKDGTTWTLEARSRA